MEWKCSSYFCIANKEFLRVEHELGGLRNREFSRSNMVILMCFSHWNREINSQTIMRSYEMTLYHSQIESSNGASFRQILKVRTVWYSAASLSQDPALTGHNYTAQCHSSGAANRVRLVVLESRETILETCSTVQIAICGLHSVPTIFQDPTPVRKPRMMLSWGIWVESANPVDFSKLSGLLRQDGECQTSKKLHQSVGKHLY